MKLFTLIPIIFLSCSAGNIPQKAPTSSSLNTEGTIYYDLSKEESEDYYSTLSNGDKGDELLTKLQSILKEGQTKLKYDSGNTSSTDWDGYYLFERNFDLSPLEESELGGNYKTSGIRLNILYSSSPIYIDNKINSGEYKYYDEDGNIVTAQFSSYTAQFDREHVFPKSYGFNGSNDAYKKYTAGCDVHNLHAGEHNGNSSGHKNYPYGNVANKNASSTKAITSGLTGEIVGYLGNNTDGIKVFEPLDENKGDIARSIFYMAARYHTYEEISSTDLSPSLTLADGVTSGGTVEPDETISSPCAYGELSDLLEWNVEDPVSEYEIHRNNLIYNSIQGNRNPFIDYPSWAEACFTPEKSEGISFGETGEDPSTPDNPSSPDDPSATYSLFIEQTDDFKSTYYQFEQFDPSGIKATLLKDNELVTDFTYTLYMGEQVMTEKYMILGLGEKEITAKVEIDGKIITSTNSLKIKLELSLIQIYTLVAIIVAILIVIILIMVMSNKRKNKKKIKAFSNKISKSKK